MRHSKRICTLAFTGLFMLATLAACGQAEQTIKIEVLEESLKVPQVEAPVVDKANTIVDMLNAMGQVEACAANRTNATSKAVFENVLRKEAQILLHDIASGEPVYTEDGKLQAVNLEIAAAEKLTQGIEGIKEAGIQVRDGLAKNFPDYEFEGEVLCISLTPFMLDEEKPVETIYELYNWLASEEEPTVYTIGLAHERIGETDCYLLLTGRKEPQKQGEQNEDKAEGDPEEEKLPEHGEEVEPETSAE